MISNRGICRSKKRFNRNGSIDLCNNDSYILVFEDEFQGSDLNLNDWQYRDRIRYCNDEQQYYTEGDNLEFSNDAIHLVAKEETIFARAEDGTPPNEDLYCDDENRGRNERNFYFTSANFETIKKFSHGIFEARVQIPKGKGFWPAFWLHGGDPVTNEIDIFEFWNEYFAGIYMSGRNSRVHNMTIHYDHDADGDPSMCNSSYLDDDFSQDYFIFSLKWEPNILEWYVNGNLKRTDYRYHENMSDPVECDIVAWTPYLMNDLFPQDPMRIIFNFAIQSGADSPDATTTFPSQMSVDWVRYYEKSPLSSVIITNSNQYPLDDEVYNTIIGETVEFDCTYQIQASDQLAVIATNSITLNEGFFAGSGSSVSLMID
ncbi:MAG: glycoside hydrolase family 16 protein [Bacteroidales bacterium]|nr:glycoside hydrolase family 16 protein [Bacteroidales bacterium]